MTIIETTRQLKQFCNGWPQEASLGLDMEFERERSYFPVLQLVQVANAEKSALVDPLRIKDMSPLWDLIADPQVEILLHAGSQDMEIFHHETGLIPRNVFDTQIAAALMGMGEQVGYADLVRRLLNVRIKKAERTTDWSRRPLSEAQQEYAINDVRYLHEIADQLKKTLNSRKRLPWMDEELDFYYREDTYAPDPQLLWRKIARHRSMDPKGLAILRELAIWREETAKHRDIPRMRVIQDDVLIDIARKSPRKAEDLKTLRRLHPNELRRSGSALVEAVEKGRDVPPDQRPVLPPLREEDPQLNVTVDLLGVFVRQRAKEMAIAPSYLATKKDLSQLIMQWKKQRGEINSIRLLQGWRRKWVGEDLLRLLNGKLSLSVDPKTGKMLTKKV